MGGTTDEEVKEREKGGIEKEEVLQPLHVAASVGSEGVCTTLINAGAKVRVHTDIIAHAYMQVYTQVVHIVYTHTKIIINNINIIVGKYMQSVVTNEGKPLKFIF